MKTKLTFKKGHQMLLIKCKYEGHSCKLWNVVRSSRLLSIKSPSDEPRGAGSESRRRPLSVGCGGSLGSGSPFRFTGPAAPRSPGRCGPVPAAVPRSQRRTVRSGARRQHTPPLAPETERASATRKGGRKGETGPMCVCVKLQPGQPLKGR